MAELEHFPGDSSSDDAPATAAITVLEDDEDDEHLSTLALTTKNGRPREDIGVSTNARVFLDDQARVKRHRKVSGEKRKRRRLDKNREPFETRVILMQDEPPLLGQEEGNDGDLEDYDSLLRDWNSMEDRTGHSEHEENDGLPQTILPLPPPHTVSRCSLSSPPPAQHQSKRATDCIVNPVVSSRTVRGTIDPSNAIAAASEMRDKMWGLGATGQEMAINSDAARGIIFSIKHSGSWEPCPICADIRLCEALGAIIPTGVVENCLDFLRAKRPELADESVLRRHLEHAPMSNSVKDKYMVQTLITQSFSMAYNLGAEYAMDVVTKHGVMKVPNKHNIAGFGLAAKTFMQLLKAKQELLKNSYGVSSRNDEALLSSSANKTADDGYESVHSADAASEC